MRQGNLSRTAAMREQRVFRPSVHVAKQSFLHLFYSAIRIYLVVELVRVVSLFEEDVDSTFFSSAPGHILMHCEVCERQRVLSALLLGSEPEVYCSGGRLFGKHKKTRMLRLGSRDKESSG